MKKVFSLLLLMLLPVSFAQQENEIPNGMKPLQVSISKSLYLPPEMYGHWSVTATLVEGNWPATNRIAHDIWVLEQRGDQIVLSNPVSEASSAIQVDRVEGDTATFHHKAYPTRKQVIMEKPTITVNGDRMTGTNKVLFQQINKNGHVIRSFYSVYRLNAERISDDRTKFKDQAEVDAELDFEIDEVLPERPSQRPAFQ